MAASLLVGLVSKRPNNVSTDCWALSSIASIDCCYVCTLYSYSQIIMRGRPVVTISNEGGTMVQSPGQPHIITPWRLTFPLVCPWHYLSPPTISPICLSQPRKKTYLRFLFVLILTLLSTILAPRYTAQQGPHMEPPLLDMGRLRHHTQHHPPPMGREATMTTRWIEKKFLGTVSQRISVNQRKYFVHWNLK